MLDADTIIQQVKARTAPGTWHIFTAKGSYFVMSALLWSAFAVGTILAAAYLVLSGTIVGYGVNDNTPESIANFWFIADMLFLAVCTLGGFALAINQLIAMRSVDEQVLVLTPDGFVRRTNASAKGTLVVNYANLATAAHALRKSTHYLDVQLANGRRLKH